MNTDTHRYHRFDIQFIRVNLCESAVPFQLCDFTVMFKLETVDLLIIGSPTHGALPTEAIQSLVERIGSPAREGAKAATFDTRLTWKFLERWGGFAAAKMADRLKEKGWTLAGAPGGFFVRGLRKGPLKRGETDRAAAWAKRLVESQT